MTAGGATSGDDVAQLGALVVIVDGRRLRDSQLGSVIRLEAAEGLGDTPGLARDRGPAGCPEMRWLWLV